MILKLNFGSDVNKDLDVEFTSLAHLGTLVGGDLLIWVGDKDIDFDKDVYVDKDVDLPAGTLVGGDLLIWVVDKWLFRQVRTCPARRQVGSDERNI